MILIMIVKMTDVTLESRSNPEEMKYMLRHRTDANNHKDTLDRLVVCDVCVLTRWLQGARVERSTLAQAFRTFGVG